MLWVSNGLVDVTLQQAYLSESGYSTGNLGFLWYHGGDQDFDWSILRSDS
ncbi:hypothetical protein EDB87DRAFT_1690591 [Lactarius vividus]|nr:hypothetical protein EDB87DRAFT_1690591 [Lactarius vividus]